MQISQGKKIYFASDFHLGAPNYEASLVREKKIVAWLDSISKDAQEIFLLGDVFDFWFEYKQTIPKGFVRLQGKIAELTDKGIKIHWFYGNHDMWIFDYLPKELGVIIHQSEIQITINNKLFYIGHGDGLGPGDRSYKILKKVFRSRFCQWAFARLHPNFGIAIANLFSKRSRLSTGDSDDIFYGEEKEMLIQYCHSIIKQQPINYFLFGHRHYPLVHQLSEESTYINTGDWIKHFTFAEFDGNDILLKEYSGN